MASSGSDAPSYLGYWGKAGEEGDHHPLAWHCLDVAAVGAEMLARDPYLLRQIECSSGLSAAAIQSALPFLLALHDVGKFSEGFQDLRADLSARLGGHRARRPYSVRHDTLGASLLIQVLVPSLVTEGLIMAPGLDARDSLYFLEPWLRSVAGHHGEPPDAVRATQHFSPKARQDALAMARVFAPLLGTPRLELPVGADPERALAASSWPVAGLAVLADWIGSNKRYFQYRSDILDPSAYWDLARAQARKALDESELGPFAVATHAGFSTLFPSIVTPSPCQRAVEMVDLPDGPVLAVVEDLTGSGKTEAALELCSRLMSSGRAAGVYFALPTMATANAMHKRVEAIYRHLYASGEVPPLLLAHSAARLGLEPVRDDPAPAGETSATSTSLRWLADSRKKALLAAVGVGTIDQALLGVLTSRHGTLRLTGLGRNVLVVDEVHAFDTYQAELLAKLLAVHASNGGSAVLLSATFPTALRTKLVNAYHRGLGSSLLPLRGDAYPQLTVAGAGSLTEHAVLARAGSEREIPVQFEENEDQVEAALIAAVSSGGCACWIRNTVRDAVKTYRRVVERLGVDRVTLFHARFALGDRLRIEREVMESFGPGSEPGRRSGRLVIATQVVEQSLDLDFDVLATDVAPIDLLIQRSGRLRRHPRTAEGHRAAVEGRPTTPLIVLAPAWSDEPGPNWLSSALAGTSYVYRDPGAIWSTVRVLRRLRAIRVPAEARELVEAVYGAEAQATVPAGLEAARSKAEGIAAADRSLARLNAINPELGYLRDLAWQDDRIVPTRLGEPTITLRLGRLDGGVMAPLVHGSTPTQAWQLSQVSVRLMSVARRASEDEPSAKAAEATMHDGGESCLTIALRVEADGWRGRALDARERPVTVRYRHDTGLEVTRGAPA